MDNISRLTDDVLIKILSLLETKDVIAISILSKRWRSLWTLVPRLIFGENSEEEHADVFIPESLFNNLSQFVYGTLLLNKAPVLECFHLNNVSSSNTSGVELWVRMAVDRFLRDLKIHLFHYENIRLPIRLFRSETLERLELRKVIFTEIPSKFILKSLKVLRLLYVKFEDEESFNRLISNCPVLEDLLVEICHDDNVAKFTINVPSLESLSIRHTSCDLETENDVFVVHYHSLKKLTIVDYFSGLELIGSNVPVLVEANLLSLSCQDKVIKKFPCVKRLNLCLPEEARYPSGTVLLHVVSLELCICEQLWTDTLVTVLQHCPKLQVLKLAMNHSVTEERETCWIEPSCVPECLVFRLKTFKWLEYEGTELHQQVAVYVLKNARRLVNATIYPDSNESADKGKIFEELEIASRGVRACGITMGFY